MKKILSILAIAIISTSAMGMENMPEGTYTGNAKWKDNQGNSGSYQKETTIVDDRVASIYQYEETNKKYDFEAPFDSQGFFPVKINGIEVGTGYCMTVQCHYRIAQGGILVEETFTFKGNKLFVLGSKTIGDKVISWEEVLVKE